MGWFLAKQYYEAMHALKMAEAGTAQPRASSAAEAQRDSVRSAYSTLALDGTLPSGNCCGGTALAPENSRRLGYRSRPRSLGAPCASGCVV